MATVSFRVPDDLRHRMDSQDLDWAARLRVLLEEEVAYVERLQALERLRALRQRHAREAKRWSASAEVIRSRRRDH